MDKSYVSVNHAEPTMTGQTDPNQPAQKPNEQPAEALTDAQKVTLDTAQSIINERRDEHIETIVAHSDVTKEELANESYESLKLMARAAKAKQGEAPTYDGRGGPAVKDNEGEVAPLPIPGQTKANSE